MTHIHSSIRTALGAMAISATCALAAAAILAGTASAKTIEFMKYNGAFPAASFDGSGSVGGPTPFESGLHDMGIFQETGQVFVGSPGSNRIYKFSGAGAAEPFSALSPATTIAQTLNSFGDVFVDNSATSTKGRIYAFPESGPVAAYEPDGTPAPNFPVGVVGACSGDVAPDGSVWIGSYSQSKAIQFDSATGEPTGNAVSLARPCDLVIDSHGDFYIVQEGFGAVRKYSSTGAELGIIDEETSEGEPEIAVDRSDDHLFVDHRSYITEYNATGALVGKFGRPDGSYPGLQNSDGIAVRESDHVVYATSENSPVRVDTFGQSGPVVVPDVTTGSAKPEGASATLAGTVNADSVPTTDCHFDWGSSISYGQSAPCGEGSVFTGASDHSVTAVISGLTKGTVYHYRVSAQNSSGVVIDGKDQTFTAQGTPSVTEEFVSNVNTDSARIHATINPDHGETTFHVEYGTSTSYGSTAPIPDAPVVGPTSTPETVSGEIAGLQPGTEYHYKVVATNRAGSGESIADHTFKTFAFVPMLNDKCPNALARQQTGAALLLDCRAYELVSAANADGYDVESTLVPGEKPFEAFPRATDRVLYGVHNGGIPGSGSPTNNGIDPYVAQRGPDGWTTKYVGIPADGTPSKSPFASPLLSADQNLETFAFGGSDICQPCFADGTSGVPVRRPDGTLVQGMTGQVQPNSPATDDGLIAEPMSADGKHLVFGSVLRFQGDGNDNTGDVSIYDRDLDTGVTQVVSKTPAGANLPCLQGSGACHSPSDKDGIAELAISHDGSRIVVAQKMATDAAGNDYWHPYMHVDGSSNTVDLAPGTTTGVLFDGMTSDGSRVFFTTKDRLLPAEDTDSSADIYEARVGGGGTATLRLISVLSDGSPSNDDSCTPPNEPNTWNTDVGDGRCGELAFAGGAGVASGDGTFYFVSPEQLDGTKGEKDQANLYVVKPDGAPQFVGLLDTSVGKPPPPPPDHALEDPDLITGLETPESLAVDQRNGDLYVYERGGQKIARYDATGAPKAFTAAKPYVSGNKITSLSNFFFFGGRDELAVDGHVGSPFEGDIYATNEFGSNLAVFSNNGERLGEIGAFNSICGVAVDQSSGTVYVADLRESETETKIRRLEPISNAAPVSLADYKETSIITQGVGPCDLAVGSGGQIYGANTNINGEGPLEKYLESEFETVPPTASGTQVAAKVLAVGTDPANGDLYVDEGGQIAQFDSTGKPLHTFGAEDIGANSRGVAVDPVHGYVYAARPPESIARFGVVSVPKKPIDNRAVAHGTSQPSVHSYEDFQVTPDGRYAAFASSQPLTGYDSSSHLEVFRYDAKEDETVCVSCAPTHARATGDATLATDGLSLTDDGRVFFTSTEPLVLRDTDSVMDAYEWSNGETQLISAGSSLFPSSLFSVSADGKDAFFFTRDKLSNEDENGNVMKIYDAREEGGQFLVPQPPQCAASDECHGPGSQQPAKPGTASLAGTEGNVLAPTRGCRRGLVKRHGKCVKKHPRHHRGAGRRRDARGRYGNRNGSGG